MKSSDRCVVFYEAWQMECCGEGFRVGDTVRWPVLGGSDFTLSEEVGHADYLYEAHYDDHTRLIMLEGRVESVRIFYRRLRLSGGSPSSLVPADGGKHISEEAIEVHGGEMQGNGMRAEGYVVELSGVALRPAQPEDITYR